MLTPHELTTLRIQIGHHKCVSKVVAISVERMESLFGMIDAQAAKIAELENERNHWKANHENQVSRARILIERPDMPIERVRAYRHYQDMQLALQEHQCFFGRIASAVGMPECPSMNEVADAVHNLSMLPASCASQTANSEAQAGLYRNGEAQECPCNACHDERLAANPPADRMASLMALTSRGMVLCPTCGNKRCPHANDHRHTCTGSNLPGQPGSAYPNNETRYPLDGVESDGGEL